MISQYLVFLVVGSLFSAVTGKKEEHGNFCRDLTDYGKLKSVNETQQVCTSRLEKKCENKTDRQCMLVTQLECEVELFTNCTTDWTTHNVTTSIPTTVNKTLPTCSKQTRPEQHEKVHYECKNVTKQHCTSLCKDVTWEECDAVPVKVEWEVPYMDCIPRDYPYLSYQNITMPVMADTMDCQVENRTICKPTEIEKCARINYMTCTEVPVTTCQPVSVPCPAKEKIHKQWCLFDQISYTPSSLSPSSLSPSSSNTRTPQTKTKEDQEILGIFESFDLRTVRESNEELV